MKRYLLVVVLVALAIASALTLANEYQFATIPHAVLLLARWAALAVLIVYGIQKKSLTAWIIIFMLLGAEVGHDWPGLSKNLKVLGQIFLQMIKSIIAPLLFGTLVVGIAGHSNLKQVGRMGVKALVYFEVITTFALFIGLAAINLTRAGVGLTLPASTATMTAPPPQSATDVILHIFPENIAKSVAEGQVLQVVVFSIVFAIALAMISEAKRKPMLDFCESLSEIMFKFTNIVMFFAPIGVGAAIAYTVGNMGLGILVTLGKLLLTLYLALFAFILLVLLPVMLILKVPLKAFVRAVAEPASIAFATTSSEAALPRAMEAMEAMGVPRGIVAFVIPTGYSFNLDGSSIYLSLATIFVAQAAGIHLGFGHQIAIVFTLMLMSKGLAGVPRASLVVLLAMSSQFNLPTEPIFVILGIDVLMDMGRTALNVIGNCLATVVVAKWEGEFGKGVPSETVQEALAD